MSQCVPTWDVDDSPTTARHSHRSHGAAADIPLLEEYEVAELTWENGQLALHGLGPPRAQTQTKYVSGGTLESIVNQATNSNNKGMDAMVPGSCRRDHPEEEAAAPKRPRRGDQISVSGSATVGRIRTTDSSGMGFTSTSLDDHYSFSPEMEVTHEEDTKNTAAKSSVSTKRSRAAAIHNQSERKRRDKINQRMKTLQKLVPNSSKVSMMSRMSMPSMMLPMAMQQQLQMSMMANHMGLGMGLGVMDMNSMNRAASNMMPNPFMPMAWDTAASNDCRYPSPVIPDPMAAFLSCQSQPMTMDAYSRMAALYQQMQQHLPPPSNLK
ncbi:PREDICTED: transcription factor UNE10 isoform X2 [Tarenaya hassleriana]|uniref:transcription factor UNE10 isoform X2 n=1 Tax=Tarenaya hassleriana TaxID=28532 RepID=UPI00053C87DD|nr:PREDICTED: transcription factor UNE10 isoform X2 [Tarenaya hassleriana]